MNWWISNLRCIFVAVVFLALLTVASEPMAAVYVYEVSTADSTYHTASKLPPDAFLYYNGGEDIIYSLKVIKAYKGNDFNQALKDYGLEDKNIRLLPHIRSENNNIKRRPYYWWR